MYIWASHVSSMGKSWGGRLKGVLGGGVCDVVLALVPKPWDTWDTWAGEKI